MPARRGQFTFYRSYYESLKNTPPETRLALYDAIGAYALDGTEPELTGIELSIFTLIRPTLDTGRRKAESGKTGGKQGKGTPKQKQSKSKTEANEKQNGNGAEADRKRGETGSKPGTRGNPKRGEAETEKEKEKEKEKENEIEIEVEEESLARARAREETAAAAAVVEAYRSRINPMASETSLAELEAFVRDVGPDCCLRAFDIALDNKAANWRYIRGILSSIRSQGVKCLADWDAIEQHRADQKSRSEGPGIACGWRQPQRSEAEKQALRQEEDRRGQEDLDRLARMMGLEDEA